MTEEIEKAFQNVANNKIHLYFPNGNGISTIWGSGSYTENHDVGFEPPFTHDGFMKAFSAFMGSNDVEIMLLKCPEKLSKKIHKKYDRSGDGSVIGHIKIMEWLDILNMLAKEKKVDKAE